MRLMWVQQGLPMLVQWGSPMRLMRALLMRLLRVQQGLLMLVQWALPMRLLRVQAAGRLQ